MSEILTPERIKTWRDAYGHDEVVDSHEAIRADREELRSNFIASINEQAAFSLRAINELRAERDAERQRADASEKNARCLQADAAAHYGALSNAVQVLTAHLFQLEARNTIPAATSIGGQLAECVQAVLAYHTSEASELRGRLAAAEGRADQAEHLVSECRNLIVKVREERDHLGSRMALAQRERDSLQARLVALEQSAHFLLDGLQSAGESFFCRDLKLMPTIRTAVESLSEALTAPAAKVEQTDKGETPCAD